MLSNLEIRLQNFKSYLDSGWINLDGKNILVGVDYRGYSNGSGKSSILDALSLFLDNSWTSYSKSEVKTLTNINCGKKDYIIISVRCIIDGEKFEAQITGIDTFVVNGDKYKLAKFQQELSGSIMNQGLINNLADFDKKSQLDDYIDQFYKVKDIVVKLKDFQVSTVNKINESLSVVLGNLSSKQGELQTIQQRLYNIQGQISTYEQYKDLDLVSVQEDKSRLLKELSDLNKDYFNLKNNLYIEKNNLSNRLEELSEIHSIGEHISSLEIAKAHFIVQKQSEFIYQCNHKLNNLVKDYINKIQTKYKNQYYEELENKKKSRREYLLNLQNKISELSNKSNSYVLNEKEIQEVNNLLRDWYPEEFKLGDTYGDIFTSLNLVVTKVRDYLDQESEELISLREEYNNCPKVNDAYSDIQLKALQLDISVLNKESINSNISREFYLIWNYNFSTNKFEVESKLPSIEEFGECLDYELCLDNIEPFSCDTTTYDNKIASLKEKANVDSIEETKSINNRISEIEKELLNLSEQESTYQRINSELTSVENKLLNYRKYLELTEQITIINNNISELNKDIDKLQEDVNTYSKRRDDLTKLVDSVSKYSGEELRNEFGFKLAKLSSILLNDIFNLEGTISLESNNSRTAFKYNDGNGFLSFKVLSGGQLQKIKLSINLAMLLFFYKDRQYIFLDEVFQHLDTPSKNMLINYLSKCLGIKNILLIQHESLKFEGFKEIKIYRDEKRNTSVMKGE